MRMKKQGSWLRWLLFVAISAALFAIIWVAWSITQHRNIIPGASTLQSDTTVSVGLRTAPESLDIRTQEGTAVEQALLGNVMETLVTRYQSNTIQPGLASKWSISDDGLHYSFTLNSNMRFSNGHTLDANDVVWSLQQGVNEHYLDYDQLTNLTAVENDGTNTVNLTLSAPNPQLLRTLSGRAGIVYDSQANPDYAKAPIGSGPFTVADYQQGSSLTLQRNDQYWGQQAKSSQVTLRYYADDNSLLQAVQHNDIQLALPQTAPDVEALSADPSLRISTGMGTEKVLVAFNSGTDSIFSDEQARKAARFAIDAASIASSRSDAAQALGGPISPLEPGYEDLTNLFPYSPSTASSMFSYFSSSYLGTATFLVPNEYADLGQTIAQQLQSNSGFTVDMQTVDDSTLHSRMQSGDYTLALYTMDGTTDVSAFSSADSVFHYQNGSAQEAYTNALVATNDKDYQDRLKAYANLLSQDAASHWLYVRKDFIIAQSKLDGYTTNMTTHLLPLRDVATR